MQLERTTMTGLMKPQQRLQFALARFQVADANGKPVQSAYINIRCVNAEGKKQKVSGHADATGYACLSVAQALLPQLPMEADYDIRSIQGLQERGTVRVGGNEVVHVT